jgi:hypothetical protein
MPEPVDHPDLSDFETALRNLRPHEELDRPALWHRAGRASVRRGWFWPLATGASSALAAVLGFLLLTRPVERIVITVPVPVQVPPAPEVRPPEPEPPSTAPDRGTPFAVALPEKTEGTFSPDTLRLREHILRWGFDGLPMPQGPVSSAPPETPASLLRAD